MDAIKLLGGLLGTSASSNNVFGTLMKGAMSGGGSPQQQQGLTGLLGGLLGGGATGGGGSSASTGLMGSVLKAAVMKQMGMGGASSGVAASGGGAVGQLLGSLLGGAGGGTAQAVEQADPLANVSQQDANEQATLMIRAMCNAAKADGQVDESERQAIISKLGGDLDQSEIDFLEKELSSPVDVAAFARTVPRELAPMIYTMSVMTVKVDTHQEAQYLGQLAQALNLNNNEIQQIHTQLGLS